MKVNISAKNLNKVLLFIFFLLSLSMTAFAANDIEWVEKQSGIELYWGDSVTVNDYLIKAEDFSNNSVFISVSRDGKKLLTAPLSGGMDIVFNDELKIYANEINQNYETITMNGIDFKKAGGNPSVKLTIFVRGEPKLDIKVETDKDTYNPKSAGESKIDVTVKVENTGDAKAKNNVLTIDTAGLELINGKTEYRYSEIDKSESLKPITLTLKTPAPWEDTDFKIVANATCMDIKDKTLQSGGLKLIRVEKKWDLAVSKAFPLERNMGEVVPVSVTIRNKGMCEIRNIALNDSIAPGLHLLENMTLNKTVSLKSGEKAEKILVYSLVPEAPGEYKVPLCIAAFTLPNGQPTEVSSENSGTIKIKAPDVKVTKTIDKQQLNVGENLTVIITALNNRNINLNVRLNDTLPPGAKLVRGETSSKQILKSGGGSMSINYTIQMNQEGEIKLPACKGNFIDISKNSVEILSESPIVNVVSPFTLAANTTTKAGNISSTQAVKNSSVQAENNSSSSGQLGGPNGSNGATPGLNFIPSVIAFLMVSVIWKKRNIKKEASNEAADFFVDKIGEKNNGSK